MVLANWWYTSVQHKAFSQGNVVKPLVVSVQSVLVVEFLDADKKRITIWLRSCHACGIHFGGENSGGFT